MTHSHVTMDVVFPGRGDWGPPSEALRLACRTSHLGQRKQAGVALLRIRVLLMGCFDIRPHSGFSSMTCGEKNPKLGGSKYVAKIPMFFD